ncbi:MAG: hypothetical protein Q9207_003083 [Kuettlingeria erythrocarpa]
MSWYLDRQSMSTVYASILQYEFYPYGYFATDASQQSTFRAHNYAEYKRFTDHESAIDALRSKIRSMTPSEGCMDPALLLWKGQMQQLNEKMGWVQEKLDGVAGEIEHAFANSLR